MRISRKYIYITVIAVLMAIAAAVSRMYYSSPAPSAAVTVEEQQYLLLTDEDGHDTLRAFVYPGKDTLVATAGDSLFLRRITRKRQASWVNRLWLPSCFGLAACRTDSMEERRQEPIPADAVPKLLRQELANLNTLQRKYCMLLSEIDYYMHSHDMQDEGFDVVIRHREKVLHKQDSVSTLTAAIQRLCRAKGFRVENQSAYSIVYGKERFKAKESVTLRKGYKVFRTTDDGARLFFRQFKADGFRPVYLGADDIGYGETPSKALSAPADTVIRRIPSRGQNLVAIYCKGGGYYEGEYSDSLKARHGFGIGFDSHVRAGKWENGVFKGEQPVYSANHIYGIDISRWHCCQKGKERKAMAQDKGEAEDCLSYTMGSSAHNLSRHNVEEKGQRSCRFPHLVRVYKEHGEHKYQERLLPQRLRTGTQTWIQGGLIPFLLYQEKRLSTGCVLHFQQPLQQRRPASCARPRTYRGTDKGYGR